MKHDAIYTCMLTNAYILVKTVRDQTFEYSFQDDRCALTNMWIRMFFVTDFKIQIDKIMFCAVLLYIVKDFENASLYIGYHFA